MIYAIGGWIDGSLCSDAVECYDPSSMCWSRKSGMHLSRRLFGLCALDSKIYVFGGNCNDPMWFTSSAEVYSEESDTWQALRDAPECGETSAVTVNGVIYVLFHGKSVYSYDPISDSYRFETELPVPELYGFGTAVISSFIYVFGGAVSGKWSKKVFRLNCYNMEWTEMAPMLHCRRRCSGAAITTSSSTTTVL
jgi:hypothetical protein